MFRRVLLFAIIVVLLPGTVARGIAKEPTEILVDLGGGVKLKLVRIAPGEFQMGSNESAKETAAFFKRNYGSDYPGVVCFDTEHPQHRARVTKPFYLGAYHVTRGQFRRFINDSGYKTEAETAISRAPRDGTPRARRPTLAEDYTWRSPGFEQTDEHPVVCLSWNDAVAFCKWLSHKGGNAYRLPTEAEWEYACRAGTTTRYFSGDDPETLAKVANVADATLRARFVDWKEGIKASDGYAFTAPVGQFKPNAFGLYDMHGNAWQWCADWFGVDYYRKSPVDDPKGPDGGNARVARGGSWLDCASFAVPPVAAAVRRTSGAPTQASALPELCNRDRRFFGSENGTMTHIDSWRSQNESTDDEAEGSQPRFQSGIFEGADGVESGRMRWPSPPASLPNGDGTWRFRRFRLRWPASSKRPWHSSATAAHWSTRPNTAAGWTFAVAATVARADVAAAAAVLSPSRPAAGPSPAPLGVGKMPESQRILGNRRCDERTNHPH